MKKKSRPPNVRKGEKKAASILGKKKKNSGATQMGENRLPIGFGKGGPRSTFR